MTRMGCSCGKDRRIQDSSYPTGGTSFQFVSDAAKLVQFFVDFPCGAHKCVFVFGASGSCKGEFIWDLIAKNRVKGSDELSLIYLDVEGLITKHLKRRIMDLVREGNRFCSNLEPDQDDESGDAMSATESTPQSGTESVKTFLQEFSNVITSTWIFKLIQDDMLRQTVSSQSQRTIFLVNLIPNRISLFKRCLFLNQCPNLYQLSFDFIALNVCSTETTASYGLGPGSEASLSDSVNQMFINYFRSVHKLVEVIWQPEPMTKMLRIRVFGEKSSRGQKVKNLSEISDLLVSHNTRNIVCMNIADIPVLAGTRTGIIFVVDNTVQIDKSTVLELDSTVRDLSKVKSLIQYLQNRKIGMSQERHPSIVSSPRSHLSVTFSDQ